MENHYVSKFWFKHSSKQSAAQIQTDLKETTLRLLGLPIIGKRLINTVEETAILDVTMSKQQYLMSPCQNNNT
jgi:hypothetical protein